MYVCQPQMKISCYERRDIDLFMPFERKNSWTATTQHTTTTAAVVVSDDMLVVLTIRSRRLQ